MIKTMNKAVMIACPPCNDCLRLGANSSEVEVRSVYLSTHTELVSKMLILQYKRQAHSKFVTNIPRSSSMKFLWSKNIYSKLHSHVPKQICLIRMVIFRNSPSSVKDRIRFTRKTTNSFFLLKTKRKSCDGQKITTTTKKRLTPIFIMTLNDDGFDNPCVGNFICLMDLENPNGRQYVGYLDCGYSTARQRLSYF